VYIRWAWGCGEFSVEFSVRDHGGMTVASLVTGNTVVLKPAADSPTIAAKFIDILFEAGIPKEAVNFITGPGSAIGDVLVQHPKDSLHRIHRLEGSGAAHQRTRGQDSPGQIE